jgi:hypothetical protein
VLCALTLSISPMTASAIALGTLTLFTEQDMPPRPARWW